MTVAWELTPDEINLHQEGVPLYLRLFGKHWPPCNIFIGEEKDERLTGTLTIYDQIVKQRNEYVDKITFGNMSDEARGELARVVTDLDKILKTLTGT